MVAPVRQSQSTSCEQPVCRVGPWRPGGIHINSTPQLPPGPLQQKGWQREDLTQNQILSSPSFSELEPYAYPFTILVMSHHKMSAGATQLDSCRARYIPLLPKSCHSCLLGEHPRSRLGSPVPGQGQGSAGGTDRHGSKQGGFFLHRLFHAASEACAQSWQALLHPGNPLSP